jgi:hypothetical protein
MLSSDHQGEWATYLHDTTVAGYTSPNQRMVENVPEPIRRRVYVKPKVLRGIAPTNNKKMVDL